jgi:glycosyltransferase involved in cell wall biosynthesis
MKAAHDMATPAPIPIAHVLNTAGLGGVPEAAWQLLTRLPAERWERHLYVMSPPAGSADHSEQAAEARAERLARFEAAGIRVSGSVAGDGPLARQGAFADWLHERRIALVHTHSYKPNLQARLQAAALGPVGLPLVAHYHNQYDNKWQADGSLPLDRRLAERSAALVACSAAVASHIQDRLGLGAGRVLVVPNGVDAERFHPADPRGGRLAARQRLAAPLGISADDPTLATQPWIALVGRLCRQKGQDLLLRAAARLRTAHPDARWLLVGSADDSASRDDLLALAQALKLPPDRVSLPGHVQDMPSLYQAIDLLAAPSRWEGYGLMLVEAMACGTPIVASRAGAIPEVVGDDRPGAPPGPPGPASLVAVDDVDALAAALDTLLRDPALRAARGAAGPARAGQLGWQPSADRLDALYTELLRGPARHAGHAGQGSAT